MDAFGGLPWPLSPRAAFAFGGGVAGRGRGGDSEARSLGAEGVISDDALAERVKELACLYEVAAAFVEHRTSLEACFRRIVGILPRACRFPGNAEAALALDGTREQTEGFASASYHLRAPIVIAGRDRGEAALAYRDAGVPSAAEGPFLAEERSLLETVARQIAVFVESVEAEQRRAAAEVQLRHADRLASIGQLAAGVAHELNEPLASILGFAQLSQKVEGVPEQVRADLERIVQASLHGREIIRKLLVFARQKPAAKRRVEINALVEEAMFLLEAGCENPGIRFTRDLGEGLPAFEADPVQMRQVVTNLVINAIHAISDRGEVVVRTGVEDGAVVLVVEDTGEGMSPEVAQHAFDPFFTTKDVGQGTGLGLAVVQGIVLGHGGVIDVKTRPGRGTRFTVRLPLAGAMEGSGAVQTASLPASEGAG